LHGELQRGPHLLARPGTDAVIADENSHTAGALDSALQQRLPRDSGLKLLLVEPDSKFVLDDHGLELTHRRLVARVVSEKDIKRRSVWGGGLRHEGPCCGGNRIRRGSELVIEPAIVCD
jgi:hypothetical protein